LEDQYCGTEIIMKTLLLTITVALALSSCGVSSTLDTSRMPVKAGLLDVTFAQGGVLEFPTSELFQPLGIQSDGKIIGYTFDGNKNGFIRGWNNTPGKYTLKRLNFDGSFDSSFKLIYQTSLPQMQLKILPDDGFYEVVPGESVSKPPQISRHLPNGELDPTFGNAGTKDLSFFPKIGCVDTKTSSLIVTKFEVGGGYSIGKFREDGQSDRSFGTNGWTRGDGERFVGCTVDGRGRITTLESIKGSPWPAVLLSRYKPDGSVDPTFGNLSVSPSYLAPGWHTYPESILQTKSDQTLLSVEQRNSAGSYFGRLTDHGTNDLTFKWQLQEQGANNFAFQQTSAGAIFEDQKGRILLGPNSDSTRDDGGFRLLRLLANGDLDTAFAGNGIFEVKRNGFSGMWSGMAKDGSVFVYMTNETLNSSASSMPHAAVLYRVLPNP
jgi:hypothetical protein